ncbi:MAG: glucose-1-phosphate thymidylyltransferase, partial [Bacteroidota bacterium]
LAVRLDAAAMKALVSGGEFGHFEAFEIEEGMELKKIRRPADLFAENAAEIRRDFDLLTAGLFSEELSPTNTLIGPKENLFIAPGAEVEASILNVQNGPIYIGADAKILEGCLLRGPIALHERAVLKMGAKVYGGTTLGPVCKVGGEINNVIFHSNSNKGHDGYLGNSVIGQWCNIGADTNCSNLKNDYSEVKVWSYPENRFAKSGRQFHGLIMGDHSKAGINTMFNTGTVVGVSANVFGEGFPRTFIPSFSWGGANGFQTYRLTKALDTAKRVMARRQRELTDADRTMLEKVYEDTEKYRPK